MLDSAGVLVTGFYLTGLFAGIGWLAAAMGAFKLYAYLGGELGGDPATNRRRAAPGWPAAAIRVGLGLAAPGVAWAQAGTPLPAWILMAALAGEALDRTAFYARLEIVSPARQLRIDLEARVESYDAGPAIRSTASASSS